MNNFNPNIFGKITGVIENCDVTSFDENARTHAQEMIKKLLTYSLINDKCVDEIDGFDGKMGKDDIEESLERYETGGKFNVFIAFLLKTKAGLEVVDIEEHLDSDLKKGLKPYIDLMRVLEKIEQKITLGLKVDDVKESLDSDLKAKLKSYLEFVKKLEELTSKD